MLDVSDVLDMFNVFEVSDLFHWSDVLGVLDTFNTLEMCGMCYRFDTLLTYSIPGMSHVSGEGGRPESGTIVWLILKHQKPNKEALL